MRNIGIIILLVLCLTLLLFTGCMTNTVTPGIDMGNLGNQTGNNPNSNNYQDPSTDPVEEPGTEEPVEGPGTEEPVEEPGTEEPVEEPGTVYPQQWATGDGTAGNPWANDCIKKAYDTVPVGGTIFLRAGYYQLAGNLDVTKEINIIGEGMNETIIKTADTYGFTVLHDNCTFKQFTMDGVAQTAGDLPILNIYDCDYIIVEDVEVKNGISTGIQPLNDNYCLFKNIYAHDCGEHGMHPCGNTSGKNMYNTYQNIYAWNNADSGFDDRGIGTGTEQTNNVYDNIQCWDNTNHGIALTHQSGIVLSNSSSRGNGVNGIFLKYIKNSTISDCLSNLNASSGVLVSTDVDNVNFTSVIVMNNGNGIMVYSPNITFTSCQSYDDREIPLQKYGIALSGSITGISIINCKLLPNEIADIYNPDGAVVTIIPGKMLAKL